jgi:hypothetical protein
MMRTNQFQLLTKRIGFKQLSSTFTTVSGIDKTMVGLSNVDNNDLTNQFQQHNQLLDLKANLASPTFTGTVSGMIKQWLD